MKGPMAALPELPSKPLTGSKPRGVLRLLFRLPIWLYRLRLGWLLGRHFLLLNHTGWKSGLQRQAVVEVIRVDKASGTCFVAAGWGAKSDWFRNIQKIPGVSIVTGTKQIPARAEVLSEAESARELFDYARRQPVVFRMITLLFLGRCVGGSMENCQRLASRVPVVAFHPSGES